MPRRNRRAKVLQTDPSIETTMALPLGVRLREGNPGLGRGFLLGFPS